MDDEDNFPGLGVDVDDDLANEGSHDTLLQAWVGVIVIPDGFEISGEAFEFLARRGASLSLTMHVLLDLQFEFAHLLECPVPAPLELVGNQAVLRSAASNCFCARRAL
jgi:hypothetical protein